MSLTALQRALLAIYSLLFMAACGGLIALAWDQGEQLDIRLGDFRLLSSIAANDGPKWAFSAIMVMVALLGLMTLLVALGNDGRGKPRTTLRVRRADGTVVTLTAPVLQAIVRDELLRLPDIVEAAPGIRFGRNFVEADIDAVVRPYSSIAHTATAVAVTATRAIRDEAPGTHVAQPGVRIRYAEPHELPDDGWEAPEEFTPPPFVAHPPNLEFPSGQRHG